MSAAELLDAIASRGGTVRLNGDRIVYDLEGDAAPLLPELSQLREEIRCLLQLRATVPPMPAGLQLRSWNLKPPPVAIHVVSVVGDPAGFAAETIRQLDTAIAEPSWRWIVPHLLDKLRQVGVVVTNHQVW